MPYEVLQQPDGLLRVRLCGTLTNDDLFHFALEFARIETATAVVPARLSDLRDIERLEIDFRSILGLAESRRRRTFPNPFKSAIVASDVVHFGFARMFQTLNDNPQITIAIFGDEASALDWLHLPGLEPPDTPWEPGLP